MDEFHVQYSLNNREPNIIFLESSLQLTNQCANENASEEFAKFFSIDDDDIIILDQSECIINEVKYTLNRIINKILHRENHQSQIINFGTKRSLDFNNDEEYLLNKKVRFNLPDQDHQSSLFISENLNNKIPLKPYAQFLYHLGFDLCLEQNINENNHLLSKSTKQTLRKYNHVFHRHKIYSCKYCSFQTDISHVMDRHYRTPHTLSNSIFRNEKYRCINCSFHTFRLPELHRHVDRKHGYKLIREPSIRRYACSYCLYETDDKNHFLKHDNQCQIEQTKSRINNNLLAPFGQSNRHMNTSITTTTIQSTEKNKKHSLSTKSQPRSTSPVYGRDILDDNQSFEPIIIESDHDTSLSASSSDEDFIVSSDAESSSSTGNDDQDFELPQSRPKKTSQQLISKATTSLISHPDSLNPTTLSSLSKLLLLNGTSIPSFNSSKPLIPIQPKPSAGTSIYQMCNICGCYVYKNDFLKHINEKHNLANQSQQTNSNNTTNNSNTTVTCVTPASIVAKKATTETTTTTTTTSSTIFLLSTSTMNKQSVTLNMIKCPWCDTNFEHIDIMTGHLMRYHRMTLAASKVVVAEQMKIQGTSSSQLSLLFKQEIEAIQKDFVDKIYWKISQPKVYLHQIDNLLCFVCRTNIDDIEKHFLTTHQIPMATLNTIKQCCLCGFLGDKKKSSLYEHQLRTHSGVCYSSILKQFIRFEPPPPPLTTTTVPKDNCRSSIIPSQNQRTLATYTEKKFGCRKCDTSSRLFTFEELVQHLRANHDLNVKLHRRCIICQQTYLKGKEYNEHCLKHLKDENPSILIKRHYDIL